MDPQTFSKFLDAKDLTGNKSLHILTRIQSDSSIKRKALEPLRPPISNRIQSNAKPSLTPWISKTNRMLDDDLSYRKKCLDSSQLSALSQRDLRSSNDLLSISRVNAESHTSFIKPPAKRILAPLLPHKPLNDLGGFKKLSEIKRGSGKLPEYGQMSELPRREPECTQEIETEMVSTSVFIPA